MDFTRFLLITNMKMKDVRRIPRVTIEIILEMMNEGLTNTYKTETEREDIIYQIKCYEELLLTAK